MATHRKGQRSTEHAQKAASKMGSGPRIAPDESSLAAVLIRCRAEKDLSLEEIANEVGVTARALSSIERGLVIPRRTTRVLIEGFLHRRGYDVEGKAE